MICGEKTKPLLQKIVIVGIMGVFGGLTLALSPLEGIAIAQHRPANLVPPLPSLTNQPLIEGRQMRSIFAKASAVLQQTLGQGQPQDVIVLLEDREIRQQAAAEAATKNLSSTSRAMLDFQATQLTLVKRRVESSLPSREIIVGREYRHLPLMSLRVNTSDALNTLLNHPEVVQVYNNEKRYLTLAESLALIHQPNLANAGNAGEGTSVAVLDTGVDFTNPAFGSCLAPGASPDCKVVVAQDVAPDDGSLDDNGHGTNVAGIVLGVAPGARVIALDVFRQEAEGLVAFDTDILSAIDWVIENQATHNIVAMNLSLGGGLSSTVCDGSAYNTPFSRARSAGIIPVVAAGNDGDPFQISYPACTPGAVRVGAVYDATMGPKFCDLSTSTDQITCFSNSASFLTVLAPGSEILAAGITMSGTSQATPHVAGAVAVLSQVASDLTPDQIENILSTTGASVTDVRNGFSFPRLDILAAVDAANAGIDDPQPLPGLFHDSMENGVNGWSPQGETWAQTTSEAYSPSHAWTDSPGEQYANNANVSLRSPHITLPNAGSITLDFWHRYDLELFFDYANVWVTTDNGATYTWLWSFTGASQGWVQETLDLSEFRGQSIQIVFQLVTDNTVTADGWYIDDVTVTSHE